MTKGTADIDRRLRAIAIARHIIETDDTYRITGIKFGVSSTTVYNDIKHRLPRIDSQLTEAVQTIARTHFETKHLRGGEAIRQKWLNIKGGK